MAPFASEMAWSACSPGLGPKTPEQPARRNVESKITTRSARRFIMWTMSEGSLPPFGISGTKSLPGALKRALGAIFGLPSRRTRRPEPNPGLGVRAGTVIGRHAGEHAALSRRAERH